MSRTTSMCVSCRHTGTFSRVTSALCHKPTIGLAVLRNSGSIRSGPERIISSRYVIFLDVNCFHDMRGGCRGFDSVKVNNGDMCESRILCP